MGDRSDGDELPGMASINHDPCYHELHDVSNTFIVLVFSELASFVRKILQREENKGVELTMYLCNGSKPRTQKRHGHPAISDSSGSPECVTITFRVPQPNSAWC